MTKEEGKQFKERWRLVNEAVIAEITQTPVAVKFQQLAGMFVASPAEPDETVVIQRWARLKSAYHV